MLTTLLGTIRQAFRKALSVRVLLISAFITSVAIAPSYADDTEVFFGQNDGAFSTNPNVLFILDVSGSMRDKDGVGVSRLDRLKSAMRTLLDEASGYNVGIMTFQGKEGGGAVRYPVEDLDKVSSVVCENGLCPDQSLSLKPIKGTDDAYQNNSTFDVTVDDDRLVIGNVPVDTDGTPMTDGLADAGTTTGKIRHRSRISPSSVAEIASATTGLLTWNSNHSTNKWFYEDEASREPWFGYRFENVPLRPNAKVVSAKIIFQTTGEADQFGEVAARITGEKIGQPDPLPSFLTGNTTASLLERAAPGTRTNAVIPWNSVPGTQSNPALAGNKIETPDLTAIVQEIVELPTWTYKSSMNFIVLPADSPNYIGSPENVRKIFGSGAVDSSSRPVLEVSYALGGSDIQNTLSIALNHVDEYVNQNEHVAGTSTGVYQNTSNEVSTLFHAGAGSDPRRLALRFPNIDIPEEATISSAFLRLKTRTPQDSLDPGNAWSALEGSNTGATNGEFDDASVVTNANFSINITSELASNPESDTTTALINRPVVGNFVTWPGTDIPDTDGAQLESPNFASVIQSVVNTESWAEGNTISLLLSAGGNYTDVPSNVRNILTSNSNYKPELEITWSFDDPALASDLSRFTSAVRFRNVHIPPGSSIKGARLKMYASEASTGTESMFISGEKVANSAEFSSTQNDIGSRQKTTARATWQLEPWALENDGYTSVDISSIVQEITSQIDWCAGNPLTIFMDGEDNEILGRVAQSIEQNTSATAVSLDLEYEPVNAVSNTYCSNTNQVVATSSTLDNATEVIATNKVDVLSPNLSTEGDKVIGIRFDGVELPADAIITSATIGFTAASDLTLPFNTTIQVERSPDPALYLPWKSSAKVLSRNYGGAVNWMHNREVSNGESLYTTDVTPLLTEAITQQDWAPGNAVAFRLTAHTGLLDVVSTKGDDANSARLFVSYQSEKEDTRTLNRLNIHRTFEDTIPGGATPTVESLYEAANYFQGRPVEYGTFRGTDPIDNQYFRVSHPGTYTGGQVYRHEDCTDADLNGLRCRTERIDSRPTQPIYKSPIENQCQSNHIVLLSDGRATSNNAIPRIESLIGKSCFETPWKSDTCGVELADYLANEDQAPGIEGDQTISTHTIAFNLKDSLGDIEARESLVDLANAGNGIAQSAESANDLLLVFKQVFNNVSQSNATFVAPAASVSQFNRLRNSTDVFYGMFKPSGTARWSGNLKKYEVDVDDENEFTIVDANGVPAISENSGNFSSNAKSFWSSSSDGDDVEKGGASNTMSSTFASYLDRKVYTYTGTSKNLTDPTNRFSSDNTSIDINSFALPFAVAADANQVTDVIDWSAGRDIFDENGDNNSDDVRNHIGDPMHAAPLVASYADGESVIYMGTNEGFLHAIDSDTGSEHFSFVPEELFGNMYKFYRNDPTQKRVYGLDGGKTLWHQDLNDNGLIDQNETAILYIAMRRGGNSYYALDISNYSQPKYLWSIQGSVLTADDDTATADGDYQQLASTWSLPVKTKIMDGSSVKDVIVFGGGYDQNQDPVDDNVVVTSLEQLEGPNQVRSQDSIGQAIFIADALTGELIWKTSRSDPRFNGMDYSIPSQVRTIDINFDGIVDQIYVGDMGGQIWRMDFNNDPQVSDSINNRITAGRIAELAGDTPESNRRFYYPPDIAVISVEDTQFLSITVGSGWRAHPLDDVVEDRIYSLRSPYVFGPPIDSLGQLTYDTVKETTSGMIDVTDDIDAEVDATAKGWYLRLGTSGEKILSSSLTFNGQLAVSSYSPEFDPTSCNASLGTGSIYALNIINGSPILNLDDKGSDTDLTAEDRKDPLENPGIPPEVSILFPDIASNQKPLFQVGKEVIKDIDAGDTQKSTFWQEVTEGHDE